MAPRPNPADAAGIRERPDPAFPFQVAASPTEYALVRFTVRDRLVRQLIHLLDRLYGAAGGWPDPSNPFTPPGVERLLGQILTMEDVAIGLFDADRTELQQAERACLRRPILVDPTVSAYPLLVTNRGAAQALLAAAFMP